MQSFAESAISGLSLMGALYFAQACDHKTSAKDWALIDCANNADHDGDGVANRIDPDCPNGQTPINASLIIEVEESAVVMETSAMPPAALNRPTCSLGPQKGLGFVGDGVSEQMAWRNEINQIGSQLLREMYAGGLTQEKAVQLALVNNPDLFAAYENLELGYADLLEAGLRHNPQIIGTARYPKKQKNKMNDMAQSGNMTDKMDDSGTDKMDDTGTDKMDDSGTDNMAASASTNVMPQPRPKIDNMFDSAYNFLDFFLIPFRQRVAEAEIHVIESQIGQKVLDLVREVQVNWLMVKTLELEIDQQARIVKLHDLESELSKLQKKAGNIDSAKARSRKITYEQAGVKLKGLKANLETAREKLNRSLGLFGNEACWEIQGELDWKKDFKLPDLLSMERAAVENRPDLEAIRREIYAIAQKAKLKEPWTYTNLVVGFSAERDPSGLLTTGPSVELELPVFNFGQGEFQKYNALIEQAQKKLLSKAVQACSEVREFAKTANQYQAQLEELEGSILPDLAKQIAEYQAEYNVMVIGIYDLFYVKESEIQATIERIRALRNYMNAKTELLHAVGGSFALLGRKE